jgi:hypothetical protein
MSEVRHVVNGVLADVCCAPNDTLSGGLHESKSGSPLSLT